MNMAGQIANLIAATVFDSRALSLTFARNEQYKPRTIGGLARASLKLTYGKTIPSTGRWWERNNIHSSTLAWDIVGHDMGVIEVHLVSSVFSDSR